VQFVYLLATVDVLNYGLVDCMKSDHILIHYYVNEMLIPENKNDKIAENAVNGRRMVIPNTGDASCE